MTRQRLWQLRRLAQGLCSYADQGTVSRWCSGLERPAFDKLFTIEGFKAAYVLALAESDARIETTTVITIRRAG